jgi:hypothetical protein
MEKPKESSQRNQDCYYYLQKNLHVLAEPL